MNVLVFFAVVASALSLYTLKMEFEPPSTLAKGLLWLGYPLMAAFLWSLVVE